MRVLPAKHRARERATTSPSIRRSRARAAAGLLLTAALAIPGIALAADGKQLPPAPVVEKQVPPPPADTTRADGTTPNDPPASEPALPDPSLEAPDGTIDDDAAAESEIDVKAAEEQAKQTVAEEPAGSSAQSVEVPGESLETIDEMGEEQPGVTDPGVLASPQSEATAQGDLALAGSKEEKKADYVIVGLSAPLDTSSNDVHVVGASWDALPASVDVKLELREQINGQWGEWTGLEIDAITDSGAAAPRQSSEPYVSVAAQDLQVRLLTSDGSTPTNASVDLIGDDVQAGDAAAATRGPSADLNPGGEPAPEAAAASTSSDATVRTAALTSSVSDGGVLSADTGELVPGTDEYTVEEAASTIAKPAIKSRAAWGARAPRNHWDYAAVRGMVIHHTAGSNSYTQAQVPAILRSIQSYHMNGQGWADIGYPFLVDKFGTIWEGRAGGVTLATRGVHAINMNYTSSAVSVLGTYTTTAPSSSALNAIARLVAWKLNIHGVSPWGTMVNAGKRTSTIIGHREAPGNATACPGNAIMAKMSWMRTKARDLTPASFTFSGKGSGHGLGLSLYGAKYLAKAGWSGQKINEYYFNPAKVTTDTSNPLLRVQLVNTTSATTVTRKAGSMRLKIGSKNYSAAAVTFKMSNKVLYATIGKKTYKAPAAGFILQWTGTRYWGGTGGIVEVQRAAANKSSVRYRYGQLLVTNIGGKINISNEVTLNHEYLYGVSSVSSTWPAAAMQAVAVTNRTYALRTYNSLQGEPRAACNCHLYDDSGQTFRGWTKAGEKTYGVKWRQAVAATNKGVLTHEDNLILIHRTSSSGGKTQLRQEAYGGSAYPYYGVRGDSYSLSSTTGNPYRTWKVTLTQSQLASRLGMKNVVALTIVQNAKSGAVMGFEARASDGTTKVIKGSTETVRQKLGLRSAYFTVSRVVRF